MPVDPALVKGFIDNAVENSLKLREQLRDKEERLRRKAALLETRRRLRLELADTENHQRRINGWLAEVDRELKELGAVTTE